MNIKPKAKKPEGILYARGISKPNLDFIIKQSSKLNMSRGEYVNAVFSELRKGSRKSG